MQVNKKIVLLLIQSLLIFLLSGCQGPQGPVKIVFPPDPAEAQPNASVSKRFQDSTQKGQTAVESAIELSEKHAKLSEEAAVLRQKKQNLTDENHQLENQVAALEAQLQQTQKELAEPNDLLIEMRIELNNWKTNILGFRNEMRDADTAQLEALLKILNILSGEVKTESAQNEQAASAKISVKASQTPETHVTSISGESNE